MAGSIQQIQKDITIIETAIASLATEFEQVYQRYLAALGQAVRQQLILACYHLCSHGYPESFLQLSFSERQKFQQNLRQLSTEAQTALLGLVSPPQQLQESENPLESAYIGEFQLSAQQPSLTEEAQSEELTPLQLQLQANVPQTPPEQLVHWQEKIESAITHLLSQLSRDTNFLIQQFNIFAPKLPEPILEAASQAETATETVAGPPNLLNIMIETEDREEPQSASITRLMTIHLRLSEVEFADPTLMTERHQIRNLSAQLSQLKHDYHKKQREKAVLEAESAWRSSWFDPDQ